MIVSSGSALNFHHWKQKSISRRHCLATNLIEQGLSWLSNGIAACFCTCSTFRHGNAYNLGITLKLAQKRAHQRTCWAAK
jgi:hypothetical protein